MTYLKEADYPVGGHTGEHAHGDASDCGANDKLDLIYAYIAEHADTLRAVAGTFGVSVSDKAHEMISTNAAARTQFSKGRELLAVLEAEADSRYMDTLAGDHKEVMVVVNHRPGTTLDRDAVAAEFGPNYQSFNVDAWAFEESARAISVTEEEVEQKVAALAYYNFATAFVLSGGKMRAAALDYELAA